MMKQLFESSQLFGSNAPFIEELYENYLDNPDSVSEEWRSISIRCKTCRQGPRRCPLPDHQRLRRYGEAWPGAHRGGRRLDQKQVGVLQLINAYRFLGTRWAQLDPLKRTERPEIHELELSHYGFTEADLNQTFNTGSFHGLPSDHATLREILDAVRQTYCGSIGAEYMYMTDIAEKRWIQAVSSRPVAAGPSAEQKRILERLTAAETMERYLHTKYVGQKRFSLEGGEAPSSRWTS
jgi:2-oxoglutarate dehydrogenase E1 component